MKKKIIYIDMDGVLCDYYGAFKNALRENPDQPYPQSQYGFFLNLEPIKDSILGLYELVKSDKYDPYVLTAPSYKNPMCYTEKRFWIEKYFGLEFCKNLIISEHKHLNVGDYLIDDNLTGRGQDKFSGELIHFGSEKFPDWSTVIKYLI